MDVDAADAAAALPRRARRRGRTTLLIAAALVLGALAGTATGYAVQYHRAPTALPPLAQPQLVSPKALAPDDSTTNKSINANRHHKTDDDLAELLLTAPDGAKVDGRGYESLDIFTADFFEEPDVVLPDLVDTGIRRVASTVWIQGDVGVEVRLLQFNNRSGADDYQASQAAYMPELKYAGNRGVAIPGLAADLGHVWVDSEVRSGVRGGRALARRGDIVMDINYYDARGKASESDVMELAKRQLERL
ncbi:hypothetical protein [Streptomyces sp. AB3(2024)]|uniref:hypothetical protein n=1 Tax=Streptomyces sp. AB3(2024) TaxID=3317321 RepID=UPI0035A3CA8F